MKSRTTKPQVEERVKCLKKVKGWNELQCSPQDLRSPMLYIDLKATEYKNPPEDPSTKNVNICALAYSVLKVSVFEGRKIAWLVPLTSL